MKVKLLLITYILMGLTVCVCLIYRILPFVYFVVKNESTQGVIHKVANKHVFIHYKSYEVKFAKQDYPEILKNVQKDSKITLFITRKYPHVYPTRLEVYYKILEYLIPVLMFLLGIYKCFLMVIGKIPVYFFPT